MSDNIINIQDQLKHRRAVEQYARLWNLVEQHYDQVRKNPDPFLKRAGELVAAYERRLYEIEVALYPLLSTAPESNLAVLEPPFATEFRCLENA